MIKIKIITISRDKLPTRSLWSLSSLSRSLKEKGRKRDEAKE